MVRAPLFVPETDSTNSWCRRQLEQLPEEFLEAVDPEYAVISCGEGNSYGHPHEEAMQNYTMVGAQVLRTDQDGSVVIAATESGLQYKIIEAGNDVKAGPKDTVYVHYTGTLIDGTEFDASDKTKEPVKMMLNRVIKGWTEGLQLVGEGGKIQLFVPDSLAYGARNMGKIGPNSTLIFDVNVEKVGKVPAEEEKADSKK